MSRAWRCARVLEPAHWFPPLELDAAPELPLPDELAPLELAPLLPPELPPLLDRPPLDELLELPCAR